MRRLIPLLVVGLIAAPMAVFAQSTQGDEHASAAFGARDMADPAGHVLALREALGLTAEQVTELEAIQADYRALNEPLLEQLRDALPEDRERMRRQGPRAGERRADGPRTRGGPRGRMSERREHMEAIRPVMREIRDNRREAATAVAAVLTPEQQEALDARREEQRQAMRERVRERR
jgi:Spy/CpxP family protein refolding chaperone